MIADLIIKKFSADEKDRQWSPALRMSSAGKCARQLAYQRHAFEPVPLNARARMVFRLGDLVEQDLNDALDDVIEIENRQEEISFTIEGEEIFGHIDGEINPSTGLEIKSIGDYGFRRAKKGDVDYSYACQAHAYMKAKGWNKVLFLFYNKNTSHIHEHMVHWNVGIWEQIENRFRSVIRSTPDDLPDREYHENEKGKLPWQCSYCAQVKNCRPDHILSFDYNGKPSLKVRREDESQDRETE